MGQEASIPPVEGGGADGHLGRRPSKRQQQPLEPNGLEPPAASLGTGYEEDQSVELSSPNQQQQPQSPPSSPSAPPSAQPSQWFGRSQRPQVGILFEKKKRGRALYNSMRNLTIRGKKNVNDWETNWDNDSDSDEEEEPMGMDVHDNLAAQTTTTASAPSSPPRSAPASPPRSVPVTASSIPAVTPPEISTLPVEPTLIEPEADNDEVEWDTAEEREEEEDGDDKPRVEMFLPMLRVLGKGSFGKVSLGDYSGYY